MKKMKNIIAGALTAVCVSGTVLMTGGTISHAVTENYKSAVEEAYGTTFHHASDNRLAGSPLEADSSDGVDTATGHLILSRTDLSLEGTGGMDFELNRYYDSNEADLGHAVVEYAEELEADTVWVNYKAEDGGERRLIVNTAVISKYKDALKNLLVSYTKGEGHRGVSLDGKKDIVKETQRTSIVNNYDHHVYGVASGWQFDFPWIETVTLAEKEGWSERPVYLHYGSAGTMVIQTEADEAGKCYRITGLEDYPYQDVRLEDWEQTVDGIPVRYLLLDKTGLRTYFNADGVVVLQKDVHDNAITYTYTDKIYFSRITDSVGREIVFHYNQNDDGRKVLTSVTVQGEEVEGGVPSKTITYETEEKTYTPLQGDWLSGVVLTGATVDGSKEKYTYRTVERLVSTSGSGVASHRISTNQSFLLTKVVADGGETHYEYRACSVRAGKTGAGQDRDVVMEQFYVTREYEKDVSTGKKSNGVKYDYFQKRGNQFLSFADFREYESADKGGDGMVYEISPYGTDSLKTVTVVSSFNPNKYKTNGKYYDYKYKKDQINTDTLKLKKDTKKSVNLYIYNQNKLLTEEVSYGKEKEETLNSYKGSLVDIETTRSYGKKGSGAVTTKHGYTYDNYRNVLTSTGPKAYLKKNSGKEDLFTTVYTYNRGC